MAKFPENFLWGASSSSAQIEGGYDEGGRGLKMYLKNVTNMVLNLLLQFSTLICLWHQKKNMEAGEIDV